MSARDGVVGNRERFGGSADELRLAGGEDEGFALVWAFDNGESWHGCSGGVNLGSCVMIDAFACWCCSEVETRYLVGPEMVKEGVYICVGQGDR